MKDVLFPFTPYKFHTIQKAPPHAHKVSKMEGCDQVMSLVSGLWDLSPGCISPDDHLPVERPSQYPTVLKVATGNLRAHTGNKIDVK